MHLPQGVTVPRTWDNRIDLALHGRITDATHGQAHFGDPGSTAAGKGLPRQSVPNLTELSAGPQNDLDQVVVDPNTGPRKRHLYRTPSAYSHEHAVALKV